MQELTPVARSRRKSSVGNEKRSTEVTEDEEPDGLISGAGDTSPMQLDWFAALNQDGSNSVVSTRPPSVSAEQDPLRPLPDQYTPMLPSVSLPNLSPSKTPLYCGEPSLLLEVPLTSPHPPSFESENHFAAEQHSSMQMTESILAAGHSSSGNLEKICPTVYWIYLFTLF